MTRPGSRIAFWISASGIKRFTGDGPGYISREFCASGSLLQMSLVVQFFS